MTMRALCVLALAACSGTPSHPRSAGLETCPTPRGTRSQLATAVHAPTGPDIDEPVACKTENGSFIRVHGHGAHPITHPCSEPGCIAFQDFADAVQRRLQDRHIPVTNIDVGVCGDRSGAYDSWRASVNLNDWKDADAAISAVDAELRARDAGGSFGVSVRGGYCDLLDKRTEE